MATTFGYWKLRGLAQYIRFLLEYTGTEYEEKIYTFGPAPDYDRSQWLKEKFNLGLDFPNLPYYIDGDIKLTQSCAILRYIAEKNNLAGKTVEERAIVNMLDCEAMDLRMEIIRISYSPDFANLKDVFVNETAPAKLERLSKYLGDRQWFVGDQLTYVDFFLYEDLWVLKELEPSCLDKFDNLINFLTRVESLDTIKKYMSSSRYIEKPLHCPTAYYGA